MGLAFWRRAEAHPGWIALIEPDGTQRTAGDCLPGSTSLPTRCAGGGCGRGRHRGARAQWERRAGDLPGRAAGRLVLHAGRTGISPRPRSPTSCPTTAKRRPSSSTNATPHSGPPPPTWPGCRAGARLGYGPIPGFTPVEGPAGWPARDHPRGPRGGVVHALHLRDHGAAQGRPPGPVRAGPGRGGGAEHRPAADLRRPRPASRTCTWSRRRTITPR